MLAARRAASCVTPALDPQRALIQAYTRMILFPAEEGSRTAVVANFGRRELRLVEELPSGAPPENARLRVEVYDRHRGHTVASMRCGDLQEAEAATVTFLAGAEREDTPTVGLVAEAADVSFRPVPVATGCEDEVGVLALADGKLVAVLVRLSGELHGPEVAGFWFVEAGFGPCMPDRERMFATLDAAEAWIRERLAGKEGRDADRR